MPSASQVILLIAIALLVWVLGNLFLIIFAAILFATALDGISELITNHARIKRQRALLFVVLSLIALAITGAVTILGPLVDEIRHVWRQLPELVERTAVLFSDRVGLELEISGATDTRTGLVGEIASRAAPASAAALSITISAAIVLASGLFMAIQPALYKRGLLALLPAHRRPRIGEVMTALGRVLRWWLIGQACSMAILGTVVSTTLWLLDVPFWLGLGLLTAVLTFVPFFGPLIAAIPVLLVSFSQGVETGFTVFAIYVVLQNVEGFLMTPAIQQRAVHVPPALLISSQVAFSLLFGIPGLILAAPLICCSMVVVRMLYVEDVLGEQVDPP